MNKHNARFEDDQVVVPVQETYRKAYSPTYKCEVNLMRAHTDPFGKWIFWGVNDDKGVYCMFRECELDNMRA